MVEGTPGTPYIGDGLLLTSLCDVEGNMNYRRQEVLNVLNDSNATVMSITSFPRLGCPDFTHPANQPRPGASLSGSVFFPDEAIYNGHPRFKTLVKNIRSRRRRKVAINLPIYRDTLTANPFKESFADEEARKASKPDHVYMDAMGFGMGCCCLQLTLQATHLEEARRLYDQLTPITPIALALSAASPIFRGLLTDRDCRWEVISCSVDDRTREESGETRHLKESMFRIPKSRYESVSCYISRNGQKYNDLPLVFDKNYYELMVANKVDPAVARHVSHLFIRDPITLYKEKLEQSDSEMDHFENIQSTNWQTMRFKPPPSADSPIGWRVEFRPLEAQTSDFENAAFVVFITLLSRVILAYKLNFLMPLSLVDENMVEAQKRDAVKESKFWFRSDIMHRSSSKGPLCTVLENCNNTGISHGGNLSRQQQVSGNQGSLVVTTTSNNTASATTTATHLSSPTPRSTRFRPQSSRHHGYHQHHHLSHNHHHNHHHHHHHLNRHHSHHLNHHHHNHHHRLVTSRTPSPIGTLQSYPISSMPNGLLAADNFVTTSMTNQSISSGLGATRRNNNIGANSVNGASSNVANGTGGNAVPMETDGDSFVKMTIDEIINGREGFVGIMPIVWHYVESFEDGSNTDLVMKIKRYLRLVSDRAGLRVKTTARFMRDFVDAHPKYGHDSVVNDEVAYDLLQMMDKIGRSEIICEQLIGETNNNRHRDDNSNCASNNSHRIRSHSSNGWFSSSATASLSKGRRNDVP